eukprot:GEMP01016480.1.p1 GENE.GEMP01016480.1~~GEMP01016480.1.p1  ORF type:complete len:552 (+),score=155.26 GEMP01016480.1:61-1716(+)
MTLLSGDDLNKALEETYDLEAKLERSRSSIQAKLNASIPKVSITLPLLSTTPSHSVTNAVGKVDVANDLELGDSSSEAWSLIPLVGKLGGATIEDREKLRAKREEWEAAMERVEQAEAANCAAANSVANKKVAEMQKKAAAARKKARDAEWEMDEQARIFEEKQKESVKELHVQAVLASVSLATALCFGLAQWGCAGLIVSGVLSAVLNWLGVYRLWNVRATGIFQLLNSTFDKSKKQVNDAIDTVDDMIKGPLMKLNGAIDDLLEEQRPAFEKQAKMETALREVDPDFDVPDPEDLKRALDGCEDLVDDMLEKQQREIPKKLDEIARSTFAGRVATEKKSYDWYVVILPMGILCALNVTLALFLAYGQFAQLASPSTYAHGPRFMLEPERLAVTAAEQAEKARIYAQSLTAEFSEENVHKFFWTNVWTVVKPTLVQILLALLQSFAAWTISQRPVVARFVNKGIANLEGSINDEVNSDIADVVDKVFGQAFGEVNQVAEMFFPKCQKSLATVKVVLEKLQQGDKLAKKAGNLAKAFKDPKAALKGFKKMF